jgi:ribosome-binding factor A
MASVRIEKVAALVKKEMAVIFQQHMNDLFRGTMITVTQVRISPDMGVARIYLSFFPGDRKDKGLELVRELATTLRRKLADKVAKQLRKIPELHFYIDDSLDYYEEIDRLLKS